jgi:hypothetical protein
MPEQSKLNNKLAVNELFFGTGAFYSEGFINLDGFYH